MPSSVTANLNFPYLTLWRVFNQSQFLQQPVTQFSVSNNVITVTSHPFSTGNIVYVSESVVNDWSIRYAIRINDTQFSLATSETNALNEISTSINNNATSISNVPVIYFQNGGTPISKLISPLAAYSKSAQSFSVSDNVSIDFTLPRWGEIAALNYHGASFWTFGLISDVGNYRLGMTDNVFFTYGDSVSGTTYNTTYRNDTPSTKSSLTRQFQILIQDRRASIRVKNTSNNYITLFTSSTLSASIQGIRFFTSFALNGLALSNCSITYL